MNRFSKILSFCFFKPWPIYHRDGEADGDHDDMMKDHEELSPQVASQRHSLGFGAVVHLVAFDLELVPVTQEHGVDVIHKVRHSEQDVGAGQPMPEKETHRLMG